MNHSNPSIDRYQVEPVFAAPAPAPDLRVFVPGSKSLTNRALMLAALSDGVTKLDDILLSDDSRHFLQCLRDLGFIVFLQEELTRVRIEGCGGLLPEGSNGAKIYVGSAGTAARFLTAMLGLAGGTYHLDASEQMRKRPMAPLLASLQSLGCRVRYEGEEGHFPFTLTSQGVTADEVTVNIEDSSQFLSALMMAAVLTKKDFTIHVTGSHGLAYVDMTARLMQRFGAKVEKIYRRNPAAAASETQETRISYRIPAFQAYRSGHYLIEPDVSAACYFYAMAAVSGGSAMVYGIHQDSLQGDIAFLDLLCRMGCTYEDLRQGIRLTGPAGGALHAVDADMSTFSDQALTLAAIAPFADGPVTIRGISHIRLQECDRIEAILTNLQAMGIRAECSAEDVVTIWPGQPRPAQIRTFSDHRVAMSFTVTGLRAPGITILDPMCCRKTFENYFSEVDKIISSHGCR